MSWLIQEMLYNKLPEQLLLSSCVCHPQDINLDDFSWAEVVLQAF